MPPHLLNLGYTSEFYLRQKETNFVIRDDIEYCESRIAQEEMLARLAPSEKAGLGHSQLAMLYRSQLTALYRSLSPHEQGR